MASPVTHFEIVGKDAKRLQSFYRDAFGWEVVPAGPAYAMVHPGGEDGINGGVGSAPEGGGASRVTVYVEVNDLDATLDTVVSLGGRRLAGPTDVPGGPSIALFADPESHVIGLTRASSIGPR